MVRDDDDDDDLPDSSDRYSTLDNDTSASNPGCTRVQPWVWIAHNPKWPLLLGGGLFATLAGGLWLHWSVLIVGVLLAFVNRVYWIRINEHFRGGCINPSIVIELEPMRIAVLTDLANDEGSYPAVKVIEKKLKSVGGQRPQLGTRLATVALYSVATDDDGNVIDSDHWADFDPVPVECATSDVLSQKRALDSIDAEDFEELTSALRDLPVPPATGLHRLWHDA